VGPWHHGLQIWRVATSIVTMISGSLAPRPPDMEGMYQHTEQAAADSRQ